jgi:hypothetical protein
VDAAARVPDLGLSFVATSYKYEAIIAKTKVVSDIMQMFLNNKNSVRFERQKYIPTSPLINRLKRKKKKTCAQ